jgi:hypothetical protein
MPKTAVNFAFHSSLVVVTRFSVSDIEFRAETIRVMPAKARQPVPPRRWLRLKIEGQRLLGPCMLDLPPFAIIPGFSRSREPESLLISLDSWFASASTRHPRNDTVEEKRQRQSASASLLASSP